MGDELVLGQEVAAGLLSLPLGVWTLCSGDGRGLGQGQEQLLPALQFAAPETELLLWVCSSG